MNLFGKTMVIGLALAGLLVAGNASAAPFVYNYGDDVFVAGDGKIPAPFDAEPDLAGAQAGYKCTVFGLFWAYFWINDCSPVAFKGDTYWEDPELSAAVAAAHPESEMNPGPWQSYGKFPIGLLILGGLGFAGYKKFKGDS
jgi:hypothetical protein